MNLRDRFPRLQRSLDDLRWKVDPVIDEARGARDLLADVAKYAMARIRERYTREPVDPVVLMADHVIREAQQALIEAKKAVAFAIADEKRLAKAAEQEDENAAEWERRALLALAAGGETLADEARSRGREHTDLAEIYKRQWREQKTAVEQLKERLRALNQRIEAANRARNLMVARRMTSRTRRELQTAFARTDEMTRTLEMLANLDVALDREREGGEPGGVVH